MKPVRLSVVALAVFAYFVVSAVVSIAAGWPSQFEGPGDPSNVASEFVARGTATAPPLLPFLLLGAAGLLVRRRGWVGMTAAGVLLVIGGLFIIGGLGEIFAPEPVTTPRSVLVVGGVVAITAGGLLAGLSAAYLAAHVRAGGVLARQA